MKTKLPETYIHSFSDELTYPMVLIKPGIFKMGSEGQNADGDEKPEHLVKISQPFYIGAYPVIQEVWELVMGTNPSSYKGQRQPVENVSWIDIMEGNQDITGQPSFLAELNKKYPSKSTWQFRLPTEAEWEYAAKDGHKKALEEEQYEMKTKELYTLYSGSDQLKEVAWYDLNSHNQKKEVGMKRANELGIYDMSGNIYEWCHDWFDSAFYKKSLEQGIVDNATGPEEGHYRVVRGGLWLDDPRDCRVSFRFYWHPTGRYSGVGFRLVLSPQFTGTTSGHSEMK